MTRDAGSGLTTEVIHDLEVLDQARRALEPSLRVGEVGTVETVGGGVATVEGLPGVSVDEIVRFACGSRGVASDLGEDRVGVVLLDPGDDIEAGMVVDRTGRVLDVPAGDELLGRAIDPMGLPLDGAGPVRASWRLPIERTAPPIMDRSPVVVPLQTGIKVIDALFPIGRGQRELIVGDRQTGKTSVALATILSQRGQGVRCVYCGIGQRGSGSARLIDTLRRRGALDYTTVMIAAADDPPGLRQIAPFAATSVAEAWTEAGHDVLLVLDDLTQHARAHRELSLLLRRPPGREAYPGDVFYLHARLLERATQLSQERGGGSLTALPIIETQEQNMSAYIPTNLISITDGQILLSPHLAARGILPAVDIGRSVSRVGGKAQRPTYRDVAGRLRLAYAQFEELERFARFGADIDEETRRTLTRGHRVRETFKQGALESVPVCEQLAVLLAVGEGVFDEVPLEAVGDAERALRDALPREVGDLCDRLERGESWTDDDRRHLLALARRVVGGAPARDVRRGDEAEGGEPEERR